MTRFKSRRSRWWLAGLALAAVGAAALVWTKADFEWQEVARWLAEFNTTAVLALMATLPIAGFSIAIVYLVAGAKFGPVLGGVVVAGVTAVHLMASYWISRSVLRGPIERFLKKRKHELPHVPEGENASVAAMAVLVPGIPYFARNYLLALTDVPFRVYFWVCLPLYVARSYVTILLGDLGTEPDTRTLAILVAVYVAKLGVCAYLIWRIRRRFQQQKERGGANAVRPARSVSQ